MDNTAIRAKKENIVFKNESHRKFYEKWLSQCRYPEYCFYVDMEDFYDKA